MRASKPKYPFGLLLEKKGRSDSVTVPKTKGFAIRSFHKDWVATQSLCVSDKTKRQNVIRQGVGTGGDRPSGFAEQARQSHLPMLPHREEGDRGPRRGTFTRF